MTAPEKVKKVRVTGEKYNRKTGMYEQPVVFKADFHLDEITVDDWLHVENLSPDSYYVALGGLTFYVNRKGKKWVATPQ